LLAMLGPLPAGGAAPAGTLGLATTTSAQDTGLLDLLGPSFEKQAGVKVKGVAVGTGQALGLGRRGGAGGLLVHSPRAERQFMAEGHGSERTDVFYNDFVLVGPAADPAGLRRARTLPAAMAALSQGKAPFVSRGDDSGTHKKEQALWRAANLSPQGAWY